MPKTTPAASGPKNTRGSSSAAKAAARKPNKGPVHADPGASVDRNAEKMAQTQALVAAMPFNPTKPAEHGFANATQPQQGATAEPASRLPTGSTLSEENSNEKTGTVAP